MTAQATFSVTCGTSKMGSASGMFSPRPNVALLLGSSRVTRCAERERRHRHNSLPFHRHPRVVFLGMETKPLLPGTLDLLLLKALSLLPMHGYGIALRLRQISG